MWNTKEIAFSWAFDAPEMQPCWNYANRLTELTQSTEWASLSHMTQKELKLFSNESVIAQGIF